MVANFSFGGGYTRDKYLIILKINEETEEVCYAMATTRVRYGDFVYPGHGCNKIRGLTTSFFAAGQVIGANNKFGFEKPTHIYHGFDLYIVHYSDLEVYQIDERVEICDVLTQSEYQAFLQCVLESDSAPRKIKRFLAHP